MAAKIETSNKVETTPFDLKIPTKLVVEPFATVELPKNKQAVIYQIITPAKGDVDASSTYYAYLISKKTGVKIPSREDYYGRGSAFEHLHQIQHWLQSVAHELSIKKRTRKEVAEGDEDEE